MPQKLSLIVVATIAAIILAPRLHAAEQIEPPPQGFLR
jgi:hypothetical protein